MRSRTTLGNNGSGKTSLLDAVAVATSSLLAKVEDAQGVSIRKSDARYITVEQGSARIRQSQYPVRVEAEGSLNCQPYSWSRELVSDKARMTRRGAQELILAGERLQQSVSSGK